ncbi:hypothetical protein PHLCEN_2v9040 [Hermanssonia centrifuga]|uniref:Aminotransferase class V domain-containing protein n=1 Tax=Hermanssonia centrifuga TaxID=98765 RepID=A0A2R6NRV2_9APHY|nr:hypothetical protein PHLCEN_2v9040 [Hermanssonia centrifuga]
MDDPDRYTYDPQTAPPDFGHAVRKFWGFEDDYVNLNHGSYGSLPLPVLAQCVKMSLLAEKNPDRFHRVTYMPLLAEVRRQVAELIGAQNEEVVLVPNATHGLNTVLRNIEWREGDIILGASTTYNAIERTANYLGDRSEPPRPTVYSVLYTFPMSHEAIVDSFRAKVRELKQKHHNTQFDIIPRDKDLTGKGNRFVAVIDSITSVPGVRLPWKTLVQICREEGIWSVIDAAHSIGQELNLELSSAQPDFWVSNCHKWLYAKRGCAVLYVPLSNQHIIKSSVPTSHDYPSPGESSDNRFVSQHEWTGTMDQVPYLSVTPAIAFRKWLGGEDKINSYCHNLAIEGGKRLAELLNTQVMDKTGELTLNMTNVMLPLPFETSESKQLYPPEIVSKIAETFQNQFFNKWNTHPGIYFHGGGWWTRCSVQVWLEISDFEYVAKVLNTICEEIKETILKDSTESLKN